MALTIKYFGMLAEKIGKSTEVVDTPATTTVDALRRHLINRHPALDGITFQVAVNLSVAQAETQINPNDEVAILPPFAGG